MKIEPKNNCSLDSFSPCRQFDCGWYMKIIGKNPNTEKDVEEYGCSIAWMPIFLIENSQIQNQTGSAIESFRNKMVKSNESIKALILSSDI